MGLDMYLRANVPAPKDSVFHKVVEEHLTEEHRAELNERYPEYPNFVPSAYVSGWTFGGRQQPDPLYVALVEEIGITPTSESPSIHLKTAGDGYLIEPTVYYWRKANAIHRWFVERTQGGEDQNGQPSDVHVELLLDLIDRCERVHVDHDQAHELLPSQAGFFFGSTDYDEWYFRDVEETAKGLKAMIPQVAPKATHFVYESSW